MKKYLNKRNIYITLFALLYILCSVCSLIHSFAFFGLANNLPMSIMLGTCFELGQFAVLMSLLTSKRNQGKIMQYVLLITLTIVQVLGNVFSSFKYLMTNSVADLEYFKKPIFIWTDLPDDITTVIVTWIIGAILPCVCLLLTSMVSNYIMDTDPDDNKNLIEEDKVPELVKQEKIKEDKKEEPEPEHKIENEQVQEQTNQEEEAIKKDGRICERDNSGSKEPEGIVNETDEGNTQNLTKEEAEPEVSEPEISKSNLKSQFLNI